VGKWTAVRQLNRIDNLADWLRRHRRWPALPRQHRGRSADAPGADRDPQLEVGSPEV